jgi:hypothetical protein
MQLLLTLRAELCCDHCVDGEDAVSKRLGQEPHPFSMTHAIALLAHLRHRRSPPSIADPTNHRLCTRHHHEAEVFQLRCQGGQFRLSQRKHLANNA